MMKKHPVYLLFIFLCIMSSCDKSGKEEIKDKDLIGLSQKSVLFDEWEGRTATLSTEKSSWWIAPIRADEKITYPRLYEEQEEKPEEQIEKCDWLTVHTSYKKIEISAEPNYTGERTFELCVQADNCFRYIQGEQNQ